MIQEKQKVLAITLEKNEEEVDVGTVESYKNAQDITTALDAFNAFSSSFSQWMPKILEFL